PGHRRADRLGRLAGAASADLPGADRPDPAVLCGQPVHLLDRRPAHRRRAGAARPGRVADRLRRSPAPGPGADGHRDRLRHHRPAAGGDPGRPRPHRRRPRRRQPGRRGMSQHLVIAPILLPLAAAVVLLLWGGRDRPLQAAVSIAASAALVGIAVALASTVDSGGVAATYRLGDWPTSVAIVLVADRLSALMVLLASLLGLVNA